MSLVFGLGYSSVQNACLTYPNPGFVPKPAMGRYNCKNSTQEMEAGGVEVQGHPQPYNKFEATLGYVRPCLKQQQQEHVE